jgi:hypothetical protein
MDSLRVIEKVLCVVHGVGGALMDIWDLYHSGRDVEFRLEMAAGRFEMQPRTLSWAKDIDDLYQIGKFTDKNALRRFMEFLHNPYVGDYWLGGAVKDSKISAPSPFGEGELFCKESHYLGVNKLFFRSHCGEKVIVFQSITSVDIVCFPSRQCFIAMKHPPTKAVEDYFAKFPTFAKTLPTEITSEAFGGLIISHFFPFHFYSEAVPALERVHAKGLLAKIPAIYCRNGGAYFHPRVVWPEIPAEIGFEAGDVDQLMEGKFFLIHGTVMNQKSNDQMLHAENAYAKAVARSFDVIRGSARFDEYQRISRERPIIWFGVQATKRSWLEQVDGISSIINKLRLRYRNLFVVFDGWTSPITPRKADEEPISSDIAIVGEILRRCPGLPHILTVGWTSMEKLAVASQIDAFVTNYGTGSLHVARLMQKPGVGHINTLMDKDFHIHYQTVCLSEGVVVDHAEDIGKRADAVSYSLDWRVIYDALEEILARRQLHIESRPLS